jgi:hypothetical protein
MNTTAPHGPLVTARSGLLFLEQRLDELLGEEPWPVYRHRADPYSAIE